MSGDSHNVTTLPEALEHALGDAELLHPSDIARARRVAEETAERLDIVLARLGMVTEQDMVVALSRYIGVPIAGREDYPSDPVLEDKLSRRFLREFRVIPIQEDGNHIVLAMADPLDTYALTAVRLATGKEVEPRVASATDIEAAFVRLYERGPETLSDENYASVQERVTEEDIERLRDLASEAPVVRLVDLMVGRAVELGASDIHLEPFDGTLKLRYRIDGVLREMEPPASRLRAAITSRIKLMAKLNIAESRLPQDGRIRLTVRGKNIDLRVSTVPTMYGESVVMRILDRTAVALDFPSLGFSDSVLREFRELVDRPTGIILVTGPTGSGKTTTLYSALKRLNTGDRKILTVEDPPEYQFEGINQVAVRPQIGLTFANALRSLLRQDPDILMIGEIRDLETAQIAVQAALTGHKVLSTLHTNNAASTIGRLLDMGIEDYLLTSTLDGVVAQRLVRTICRSCHEVFEALPEFVEEAGLTQFAASKALTLHRGRGCEKCSGTGYRGRTTIAEVLPINENIRQAVLQRAESTQLQRIAIASGMRTMYEVGIDKAMEGLTTIDEVLRVTREA